MTIGGLGYDPRENKIVHLMREESAALRRQAERESVLEVMPFEREKQAVNQQVRDNAKIHGVADMATFPLEALTETDRSA